MRMVPALDVALLVIPTYGLVTIARQSEARNAVEGWSAELAFPVVTVQEQKREAQAETCAVVLRTRLETANMSKKSVHNFTANCVRTAQDWRTPSHDIWYRKRNLARSKSSDDPICY